MIRIVNKEGSEIVVTKGVYEDLYKPLGYTIKNGKTPMFVARDKEDDVVNKETKASEVEDKVNHEDTRTNFKRK